MKQLRPGVGLRFAILGLALLSVVLVAAACTPSAPAGPTAPAATKPAVQPAPATSAPAAEKAGPVAPSSAAKPGKALDLPMGVDADGNFYRGDLKAPVKLIEFSDFQWPYCARHVVQTGPLLDEAYIATGKVVSIYRHFPLDMHPNAMPAAKASYCAGQQAPKYFWGMHEWLFANQNTWANAQDAANQFRTQALALGVDGGKYDTCLTDPKTTARIQRDLEDGAKLGVQGTPAFFINDWFFSGAYPFADFQKTIAKAEQGIHPAPTPTPLPPNVQPYDVNPNRPGFTYDGSPSMGSEKAPVLLFVFGDFGCPDCDNFAKNVEVTLREKYIKPGQVRLLYKFLPISAPKTAIAALCAADQGKFWEFYDKLVAEQGKWKEGDNAAMIAYAKALGLDTAKFEKCLVDAPGQSQIDADMEFAQQVQVPGAPYFLVLNPTAQTGLRVPNLVPLADFEKAFQDVQKPQSAAPSAGSQPTPAAVAAVKRPDMPVGVDADGNFYRGDPKAPVKIIDFSDFQWPFCARHEQQTGPLLDEAYGAKGKVVTVFRNFPLSIHPNAVPAAKAAYCAGQQDPKWFWAMHDWLFANQDRWANDQKAGDQFRQQALALDVAAAKYDACLTDAKTEAVIQRDMQEGNTKGVRGTPAFFLIKTDAQGNATTTKGISGALPFDQFDQVVQSLLN